MADVGQNPKFNRGVSMVAWVYNEEDLIETFLKRAVSLMENNVADYEIVIVDDASTDRTPQIIQAFQKTHPRVRLLINEKNVNVGLSSRRAILNASKEFLFWQTIDWAYDISDLGNYLDCLQKYDVIAGVRRAPVSSQWLVLKPLLLTSRLFGKTHLVKRSDNIPKAIISNINYLLVRFLFNVPLSDYQNISIYKSSFIQKVNYEAKSSFGNPEYLLKAYWSGARIIEMPINFIPRQGGEAKGTHWRAIRASVFDILRLWFKWVVLRKIDRSRPGRITRLNQKPTDAKLEIHELARNLQ